MSNLLHRPFPEYESLPMTVRLFEDTVSRMFNQGSSRPWTPAVDISENENELILTADVPGMKQEDMDVRIEDGTLILTGSRKFEHEEKKEGYHRMERSFGSFQRAFALPDSVDPEKVSATSDNGVLKVVLSKKEIAKPRSITVNVASQHKPEPVHS
jgi:HSP20 family protein